MAVKDLALFKLVGSVVKKTKDKVVGGTLVNEAKSTEETPQATFKALLKKDNELTSLNDDISQKTEVKNDISPKAPDIEKKQVIEDKIPKDKKTTQNKSKATTKVVKKKETGSKKEAKIKLYTADIKKHLGSVDDDFLAIVVKNLGPSIYRKDAELVSCSDSKELDTVRKNFLIKKLGFDKSEKEMLDGEIQKVCEILKGTRIKYRATFYYILAKNLARESALN